MATPSAADREIFEEARDRLEVAMRADSKNRARAKEDILFREGDQWDIPRDRAHEDKPMLVINFTDALCQRVENNIREECPRGGAHPIGDGADVDTAEMIEGIGRHVEYRSSAADVAYPQAARCAINGGEGFFRLVAEYEHERSFQKEMRILPIRNAFTVWMDPESIMPAGEDAQWVIISTQMRRAEYKRRYPKASNKDWSGANTDRGDRQWEDRDRIRLAEYFRIVHKPEKLHMLQHPSGQALTRFESEMADLGDFKSVASRDVLRRRVEWYRLNGTQIVERAELPGEWIPVFRVEGNRTDVDGETIKRGMVHFLKDPQRMIDYGESAKMMRLGLAPKAEWIAAEGQLDGHPEWEESHRTSVPVLIYKPITITTTQGDVAVPPPQRQQPAQIEAGFSEMVGAMRSNLLAVAGMPNDPGQDTRGEVVSGVALQRRDKMQDKSHLQYSANLRLAIAQCWRVMCEWIPHIYREPGRIQRIIGADGQPQTVTLKQQVQEEGIARLKNDPGVGRYDVAMKAGPSYETRREQEVATVIQLLSVQPLAQLIAQHGADLVFRGMDSPYMQELANRLQALTPDGLKDVLEQLPKQAQAVVKALMGQVQQLQQALQAAQQEAKAGITKAHIAATVKAHDTEVRAETDRADTLTKAQTDILKTVLEGHTKRDVAEIAAGASLLNTHTEAKYHRAEAERVIQRGESAGRDQ